MSTVSLQDIRDTETALKVWQALARVADPEIPVVSITELGMVRDVRVERGRVEVVITPTYTGCPATRVIELEVARALAEAGYPGAKITTTLSPPWTSDWISPEGRRKLREFGIAPPTRSSGGSRLFEEEEVACPRCGSTDTIRISAFGSTPCKSLHRCNGCLEPFAHFKCL